MRIKEMAPSLSARINSELIEYEIDDSTQTSQSDHQLKQVLKDSLIEGHLKACVPTIEKQLSQSNLPFTRVKIKEHCLCLGHSYFDNFTTKDYNFVRKNSRLPPHIEKERLDKQTSCSMHLL